MTGRHGFHSRESVLAMVAQVERQGSAITARYAGGDGISGRFRDFQGFIDQLAQYHLFIDMVEARLASLDAAAREAEAKKLIGIRWRMLQMEIEATNLFLTHMVANQTPWPMGSEPFLRRRLRRLEDVAEFHAEHGARHDLAAPDAAILQAIRDQVGRQIGSSITLDDFSAAPVEDAPPEAAPAEAPPVPDTPAPDPADVSSPAAPPPAAESPVAATETEPVQPAARKPATDPSAFDLAIFGFAAPPSPAAAAETPPADETPPAPVSDEPIPDDWVLKVPATTPPPLKAAPRPVAKPVRKPAAPPPGAPKIPRGELRLKVRHDAGYNYIDGHGLAVITEACRVANTSIDELARSLDLSRPGLVLILNGKDPVSTELLKTLKRFVVKTGGMVEGQP